MGTKRIKFTVIKDDGVKAYWFAVDNQDVTSGQSVDLPTAPVENVLVWWMLGAEGATIAISGADPAGNVVITRKSAVPQNRTRGAGSKYFVIKDGANG